MNADDSRRHRRAEQVLGAPTPTYAPNPAPTPATNEERTDGDATQITQTGSHKRAFSEEVIVLDRTNEVDRSFWDFQRTETLAGCVFEELEDARKQKKSILLKSARIQGLRAERSKTGKKQMNEAASTPSKRRTAKNSNAAVEGSSSLKTKALPRLPDDAKDAF